MDLFNQTDLFGSTDKPKTQKFDLPDADVTLFEGFFTKQESDRLYKDLTDKILWQQDQIRFYGKMIDLPRLTAWYGENNKPYTYSGIPMNPHPWTEDLLFIKTRIEKEAGVNFSSVLLNLYRKGKDSVNWHCDDEKELGQNPVIGSVSFGETRPFQLRHLTRKDLSKVDIQLTTGSFLLMKGTTQHFWEHQIPKTSRDIKPRINLTFRVIA
ncbi:MAG: alpha-ketoglutarate-dependent dioxygenase AlkB [Flavobacteriales bacterium]|jgi:alkylated DNA repair dioxygenase AlkB|nr:alpha-ketoglutarate-dependent dioxygenase AlkB [Flavobacteriales bacterium]